METKITRTLFAAYLDCKFKGHLKLLGQRGVKSDYETYLDESQKQIRRGAIESILGTSKSTLSDDVVLRTSVLKSGMPFLFGCHFEN